MENLAVELLTLISFYACTDGGYTGCSLSLVSKRIRAASRPARFHSVAILGSPAKIEQFLACFQAERARALEALPRVRHLCLSLFGKGLDVTGGAPSAPSGPSPPSGKPTSRAEFLAAMQRRTQQWRSTQDDLDGQYNRVVPALFYAVAPDIQTIALIQAQWRSASVVRCHFPCLRELTVVGGDPSFLPFASMPSDRPLYPALKRLHHILAWIGKEVDFLQWAQHAPNLTHLRVTRLDYHPPTTVDTLEQVISDSASDVFFPHLQAAIISPQPAPPPVSGCGTSHLAVLEFRSRLKHIAGKAKVPVVVLPPPERPKPVPGMDPHHACLTRVRHEWMMRMEGGAACWEPVEPRPHSDLVDHSR